MQRIRKIRMIGDMSAPNSIMNAGKNKMIRWRCRSGSSLIKAGSDQLLSLIDAKKFCSNGFKVLIEAILWDRS